METPEDSGAPSPAGPATLLLDRWRGGEEAARDELIELVHEELRLVARRLMRRERRDHTLEATGVVNEAYLRLLGSGTPAKDRQEFLGLAAHVMRQVLVDHSRRKASEKRGGEWQRVTFTAGTESGSAEPQTVEAIDLDDALQRLAKLSPRQARIAELRYFGGLTLKETAGVIGVSDTIIKKEWTVACLWLRRELGAPSPAP